MIMFSDLYHFFLVIPEHLYPFKNEVEGKWVRGVRSYNLTLRRYRRKYGAGRLGFALMAYRSAFHMFGSVLVIIGATFLTRAFFGSDIALFALLFGLVFFISYQEFILHRRRYRQLWKKSIVDWFSWVMPIGVYFFFF